MNPYRKTAFDMSSRVAIITGGAGLLGQRHAEAVLEAGGIAILLDIRNKELLRAIQRLRPIGEKRIFGYATDITRTSAIQKTHDDILRKFQRVDVLINNAAINSTVSRKGVAGGTRLEDFTIHQWNKEIAVGLTGAFLTTKIFGSTMVKAGRGVILNVCSDLALIAPDQRLYHREGVPESKQMVKPVSYSVVKTGLIGFTRYLAIYWATRGIRANALLPGGVHTDQSHEFISRVSRLIPLSRLAHVDEYKAAVLFLISDASSYMTGSSLVIDGGRSAW